MKRIEIYENGINIVFEITDDNEAKLLHFSALPFDEAKTASYMGLKTFRPVEIQAVSTVLTSVTATNIS